MTVRIDDNPITRVHAFAPDPDELPRLNLEERLVGWWKAGYFEGTPATGPEDPAVLGSWAFDHGMPIIPKPSWGLGPLLGRDRARLDRILASLPARRRPSWPFILETEAHLASAHDALEYVSRWYDWAVWPGFSFSQNAALNFAMNSLYHLRRGQNEPAMKWALDALDARP